VCRPDVRCPIREDDGIVFFAEQKDSQDTKTTHYRFVAALRVADKMQHTELSKHPLFSQYLNLVVRPRGVGWEHHEPLWKAGHRDWLWKVTCKSLVTSACLPQKETKHRNAADKKMIRTEKHWEATSKAHTPGTPLTIDGHAVPIAANYVVFSRSSAVLAHDPPFVANHHKGEKHESWEDDPTSAEIRKLVLRTGCHYLRKPNSLPHRHIHHRDLKESELEEIFGRLRTALKLRSG
jgi:hypothetical protein